MRFNKEKFRDERVRQGWSMRAFARELQKEFPKASAAMIWHWENIGNPTYERLALAVKILKRDVSFFQ